MKIFVLPMIAGLLISAPQGPTFNFSTRETLTASTKTMSAPLTGQDKELFDSIVDGTIYGTALTDAFTADGVNRTLLYILKDKFAGKTARQLLNDARNEMREEHNANIKKLEKDYSELLNMKNEQRNSLLLLNNIKIVGARLYDDDSGYISERAIDLSIRNGLNKAITKIYCHGVYKSPERSVPWAEDDFNYEISGGIESQETRIFHLKPNVFSKFDDTKLSVHNGAVFNVTIFAAEFVGGKEIRIKPEVEEKFAKASAAMEKEIADYQRKSERYGL